ncbi:protocatechuate 4,5-dioxygenase beta chain/2'-aminobiphenyl-2,3-diol 1,2-dioxygenase large subunit [Paraburkholderia sp. BL18I3N2]|uniref:DODA-type extradiol aromatic ring-opening family dioxygenase n=1 Tax=Paraburkholderia sp. BL18I3N2 TaxID=1938799 RepID=UPI000D069564|nr:protocatechuate 3,4-dioxygenase [Paraburkholderia sp. BL18I3N2]PRX27299.1 protocatechuate 4,5-dioxygenase beta chain/2'-aminobiphenyl-2,3-diol 1,2-dioxygenase large subunit [Paraburkholderia sp. BL18I3N2]
MGQIVSAAATSHTFGVPEGVEVQAQRIFDGIDRIGEAIRASNPDVMLIATSDHLVNFSLDVQIPLAVGISDEWIPYGDLGVPRKAFPGNRAFAAELVAFAAQRDFDLASVENVKPDHGLSMPNAIINRGLNIPVVPIYINTVMTPAPTCARSYALGKVVREFVEFMRPTHERVAIVATGGLSHWICLPDSGRVNAAWDLQLIEKIVSGDGVGLAELSFDSIMRDGGNGGLEIAAWAFMAGATGGCTGELVYYEEMTAWWTGMGGILMTMCS